MPPIHTINSNPSTPTKPKKKSTKKSNNFSNAGRVLGSGEVKPAKDSKKRKAEELEDEEYVQPEAEIEEVVTPGKKRRRAVSEEEDATYSPSSSGRKKHAKKAPGKAPKRAVEVVEVQERQGGESGLPASDGEMKQQERVQAAEQQADPEGEDVGPAEHGEEVEASA